MSGRFSLPTNVVRQHTVPRFLLKQFAASGKGKRRRLYAFDKGSERAFATTPDDASVRNTFYDLENHPERLSLESLLGIYENDAAPVIHALIEHKDIRRLSEEERYRLAVFVAVQRARSFGEHQRIESLVSAVAAKLEAIGASQEQTEQALGLSSQQSTHNIFLAQLIEQRPHIDLLLAKDWYLYETSPGHPFYISDSPVVLYNAIDYGFYGNLGLAQKGIQIYLPISSTLTLAMLCPSIKQDFIKMKSRLEWLLAYAPWQMPASINPFDSIEVATKYATHELRAVTPDQLKWHNSLQVKFSEQYVFCGKGDFSLPAKMLADNPGYKSGPRMVFG